MKKLLAAAVAMLSIYAFAEPHAVVIANHRTTIINQYSPEIKFVIPESNIVARIVFDFAEKAPTNVTVQTVFSAPRFFANIQNPFLPVAGQYRTLDISGANGTFAVKAENFDFKPVYEQ